MDYSYWLQNVDLINKSIICYNKWGVIDMDKQIVFSLGISALIIGFIGITLIHVMIGQRLSQENI
jgi:hypothetical protein